MRLKWMHLHIVGETKVEQPEKIKLVPHKSHETRIISCIEDQPGQD